MQPRLLDEALPTLPIVLWRDARASARDGRFLELHAPAQTYAGAEIRIYLERGKPTIGVFRTRTANLPAAVARIADQPIGLLQDVQRIDIAIKPEPIAAELVIVTATKEAPVVEHPALSSRRGAPLAELVGVPAARLRVIGDSEIVIERAELAAAPAAFTLKRTHRSVYVFRRWQGEQVVEELRGIRRIVVE